VLALGKYLRQSLFRCGEVSGGWRGRIIRSLWDGYSRGIPSEMRGPRSTCLIMMYQNEIVIFIKKEMGELGVLFPLFITIQPSKSQIHCDEQRSVNKDDEIMSHCKLRISGRPKSTGSLEVWWIRLLPGIIAAMVSQDLGLLVQEPTRKCGRNSAVQRVDTSIGLLA